MDTFSFHFYLKREKIRKDGMAPLYGRITLNGKRAEFSIKRYVLPEHWDVTKGQPVRRKGKEKELTAYLESIRTKLYRHQRDFQDQNRSYNAQELKDAFLGRKNKNQEHTLISTFAYHNKLLKDRVGKDYAPLTLTRYQTARRKVEAFLLYQYKEKDIPLEKLDYPFITSYDHFLRTVAGNENNTTVKYISMLRKIIRLAIKQGWLKIDPFAGYEGKTRLKTKQHLTPEELSTLEEKEFAIPRLAQVRDIFLFSCYTGLAYTDVKNLTENHLIKMVDGSRWIHIERQKTGVPSKVPLLPQAIELIDQYSETPERKIHGKIFPVKSNQKMNAYLKEIAELCGIEKKLTFHVARHSFATTVTLNNGVPIESVSAMMGHTNIKTTQHYAKILQQKVGEDMKALQEKMQAGKRDADEAQIKKLS